MQMISLFVWQVFEVMSRDQNSLCYRKWWVPKLRLTFITSSSPVCNENYCMLSSNLMLIPIKISPDHLLLFADLMIVNHNHLSSTERMKGRESIIFIFWKLSLTSPQLNGWWDSSTSSEGYILSFTLPPDLKSSTSDGEARRKSHGISLLNNSFSFDVVSLASKPGNNRI